MREITRDYPITLKNTPILPTSGSVPKLGNTLKNTTPKMLQIKERAPILLFFHYFTLGPTFGFLKELQGVSTIDLVIEIFGSLFGKFGYCPKIEK
jgi:hypothetical protein